MSSVRPMLYAPKPLKVYPNSNPSDNSHLLASNYLFPSYKQKPFNYLQSDEDAELWIRAEVETELLKRVSFGDIKKSYERIPCRESCPVIFVPERSSNSMVKDNIFEENDD